MNTSSQNKCLFYSSSFFGSSSPWSPLPRIYPCSKSIFSVNFIFDGLTTFPVLSTFCIEFISCTCFVLHWAFSLTCSGFLHHSHCFPLHSDIMPQDTLTLGSDGALLPVPSLEHLNVLYTCFQEKAHWYSEHWKK